MWASSAETDDVLEFMKKDHNSKEAYRELSRLKQSGIAYSAHIMMGTGGRRPGLKAPRIQPAF